MNSKDHITALIFPFDMFGSAGTGEGAQLLCDVLREAIEDTAIEDRLTRPHAYANRMILEEHSFEILEQIQNWRTIGQEAARRLIASQSFFLWLGGNHVSVLPLYEELEPGTLVIQFDAHLDCYQLHDTHEDLCHGNFLLHAEKPLPKIINVGNRDLFMLPDDTKEVFVQTIAAEEITQDMLGVVKTLHAHIRRAKRVWIDIDVDVLDPVYAPAVTEPTPFGVSAQQILLLLHAVWSEKVVGLSLSEFAPGRDVRDQTLNLLGWLLERILLMHVERKPKSQY